jgi:hypothetical protein
MFVTGKLRATLNQIRRSRRSVGKHLCQSLSGRVSDTMIGLRTPSGKANFRDGPARRPGVGQVRLQQVGEAGGYAACEIGRHVTEADSVIGHA